MKNYRSIRIFVSSTFRDMDAERDAIKFQVIPRLNRKYRDAGLTFQAIDLRIGVNTSGLPEDVRENKVLDVCLKSIDEARPFFIGLVGDRYGWIPPAQRFDFILNRLSENRRPLISGCVDRSVTELEILYGAIGCEGKYIDHSLFFFRDSDSYSGIDPVALPAYTDRDDDKLSRRLRDLKLRIERLTRFTPARPITYRLSWDPMARRLSHGLDRFADLVFDRLDAIISSGLERRELQESWWESWRQNDRYIIETSCAHAAGRQEVVELLAMRLLGGERLLCRADSGSGKSTVLAMLAAKLEECDSSPVLTNFCGSGHLSLSPAEIMARWINELSQQAGLEPPFATPESASGMTQQELAGRFDSLAARLDAAPVILLDDIDALSLYDDQAACLSWLPTRAAVFATTSDSDPRLLKIDTSYSAYSLPPMTRADALAVIALWEKRNSNELGDTIRTMLADLSSNHRRLSLILDIIAGFSTADFSNIRQGDGDDEMAKITGYVSEVIADAPECPAMLMKSLYRRVAPVFVRPEMLWRAVELIATSECGLRDSDLESILGADFDMLGFRAFIGMFDDIFYEDRTLHRLRFRSRHVKDRVKAITENLPTLYRDLAAHTLALTDDDPLRRDMLLYYLLMSGDAAAIESERIFTPYDKAVKADAFDCYGVSVRYLLSTESDYLKLIRKSAAKFGQATAASFYYDLLFAGLPQISQRLPLLERLADDIFAIDPAAVDSPAAAYALAWMMSEYLIHARVNLNLPVERLIRLHNRAIEAFAHSRDLDPGRGDPSNMIMAMKAELITLYAKAGDFEAMDKVINSMNQ